VKTQFCNICHQYSFFPSPFVWSRSVIGTWVQSFSSVFSSFPFIFLSVQFSSIYQFSSVQSHLRVEFLYKTDGGYPRDAGVFFHSPWQTLGVPSVLTPIGQLYQSLFLSPIGARTLKIKALFLFAGKNSHDLFFQFL